MSTKFKTKNKIFNTLLQYNDDLLIEELIAGTTATQTFQRTQKIKRVTVNYTVTPADRNSIIEIDVALIPAVPPAPSPISATITLPLISDWKKTINNVPTDGTGTLAQNRGGGLEFIMVNTGRIEFTTSGGNNIDVSANTSIEATKGERFRIAPNNAGNTWLLVIDDRIEALEDTGNTLNTPVTILKSFSFDSNGHDYYSSSPAGGNVLFNAPAVPRKARPNYQWVLDVTTDIVFETTRIPLAGANIVELGIVTDGQGTGNFFYVPAIFNLNPHTGLSRQHIKSIPACNNITNNVSGTTRFFRPTTGTSYGLSDIGITNQIKASFLNKFSNSLTGLAGVSQATVPFITTTGGSVVDGGYSIPRGQFGGSIDKCQFSYSLKEIRITL